jgi:branched-subunit amino acid transport protein
MNVWIAVGVVGLGSFAMRVLPLVTLGRAELTERTQAAIARAGLAAVAALIAVSTRSAAHGSTTVPALAAVGVASVLGARGASMMRLVASGGAVYAALWLVVRQW